MELIILSEKRCKTSKILLGRNNILAVCLLLFLITVGAFCVGSYFTLKYSANAIVVMYKQEKMMHKQEIEQQRTMIDQAKREAENNLDALATRLSKLQGHIMRLDALGARLAAMADIDDIEFNVMEPLGMGGPALTEFQKSLQVSDFIAQLEQLSLEIEDRDDKLAAMESMLIADTLEDKTLPTGIPVPGGWMSSLFGWRADPISGKREFHEGIDFAGNPKALVIAVAAGIVTWSDRRNGYGNMVQINHGNGYVTRYAHNKMNLVAVGDKVEKGQPIAIIGSSGRTTGTHVHFEVVHNSEHVDPKKYISVN